MMTACSSDNSWSCAVDCAMCTTQRSSNLASLLSTNEQHVGQGEQHMGQSEQHVGQGELNVGQGEQHVGKGEPNVGQGE